MGAYSYCRSCGASQPGPWELTSKDILLLLFTEQEGPLCSCGEVVTDYFKDSLLDELADRIDNKREDQEP